jgi:hypothetical protein
MSDPIVSYLPRCQAWVAHLGPPWFLNFFEVQRRRRPENHEEQE